jgi:hypothetical protein
VANGARNEEEEGSEFADFMADISEEIAQRVASLDPVPRAPREEKKTPSVQLPPPDAGMIADWENVADRMIEEIR